MLLLGSSSISIIIITIIIIVVIILMPYTPSPKLVNPGSSPLLAPTPDQDRTGGHTPQTPHGHDSRAAGDASPQSQPHS